MGHEGPEGEEFSLHDGGRDQGGGRAARDDQFGKAFQPAGDLGRTRQRKLDERLVDGLAGLTGTPDLVLVGRRGDQVQPGQHPQGRLPPDGQQLAGLGGQPQRRTHDPGLAVDAEVGASAHLFEVPVRTGQRGRAAGAAQGRLGGDLIAAAPHDTVPVDPVHGLAHGLHGLGHTGQRAQGRERIGVRACRTHEYDPTQPSRVPLDGVVFFTHTCHIWLSNEYYP